MTIGKPSTRQRQVFESALLQSVQLGRVPDGLQVDPNPEPVYLVNVYNLIEGCELTDHARLVGWRYSARDPSGNWMTGEVSATLPYMLTSLRYGQVQSNSYKVKHDLANSPEVQAKDFQLRVLRIPGALAEGYWLKPADGNGLFVHLANTFNKTHKKGELHAIDAAMQQMRPLKQYPKR